MRNYFRSILEFVSTMSRLVFEKGICFILVYLSWAGIAQASNSLSDSLLAVIETAPEDTLRIDAINNLALYYMSRDLSQAIKHGEMAVDESRRLNYLKGQAKALHILGSTYQRLANYPKAAKHILESIQIQQTLGNLEGMARAQISLGLLFGYQELEEDANLTFDQAEEYFLAKGDMKMLVQTNHHRAIVKHKLNKNPEALVLYEENLKLIEKHGLSDKLWGNTLNNIGIVHEEMGQLEQAYLDFSQALKLNEEQQDFYRASGSASNLAGVCVQLRKLNKAKELLELSNNYAIKADMDAVLVENLRISSELASAQGKAKKALDLYRLHVHKRDSLDESEHKERLDNLLMVYKVHEGKNQIAILESENSAVEALRLKEQAEVKTRQSYLIASLCGAGFLLTLIFGLGMVFISNKKKRLQLGSKNEELAEKNQQLSSLNRAHQDLVQVVVHDLKAPLTKTMGLVNLIGASGNLNPEQVQFVDMLKKVNGDANHLVRELLDLHTFEMESSDHEKDSDFNGGDLLETLVKEYKEVADQKQIQIILHQPVKPVELHGRPDYVMRVLDNLISNALKFSPLERRIEVGLSNNGCLKYWVKDEGPGMSEEDRTKLFKKFQRLSARPTAGESSTGLGLSIVKTLVEKMGGSIEVDSMLGQGTEFQIILPKELLLTGEPS